MKLAFTTTFDAQDVLKWSGTPFYMAKSFEQQGMEINYIGHLTRQLPSFFKLKQFWKKTACNQRESPRFNVTAAKHYSKQVAQQLTKMNVDAIIAPQINPICYLESKQPIVLWTDGLYASLLGFYPGFSNHSATSIEQGNIITRECLSRCALAIFSSDWAAHTAQEIYGAAKEKIKVVPFGANIQCTHTIDDIRRMLKTRPRDTVKLLFLGKHWHRKGGDIVFNVAKALQAAGQSVELNFVGCQPPKNVTIPAYIKCHGFISKRTPAGLKKITDLLSQSHFLFLPSRAEAYGIAFCEANAFGLPVLTSYVGGITTIVKNNINGMTFSLEAAPSVYCDYIINLMQHYSSYEELALSAFCEYETRLNWRTATQTVKQWIEKIN
ncbi:MAG: Glycosyl transferase, group 1 family protein [uncultured bacterium]|nr:MAG: Glycosyl transferase, group 1 family protein [uncultured bacterium]